MSEESLLDELRFIETREYRRFAEFCDSCRRYRYIGVCYGPSGVGKTFSARKYSQWDIIEPIIPDYLLNPPPNIDTRELRTVLYTPTITSTPKQIDKSIHSVVGFLNFLIEDCSPDGERYSNRKIFKNYVELIIVDEADRLKMTGLEQIRDIYDRENMGIVLLGIPGIEKRLSRYPQLCSRIGFAHQFRLLGKEEVKNIFEVRWRNSCQSFSYEDLAGDELLKTIMQITNGNFRFIHRLLLQIERILAINQLHTITKEVVEAARKNLVIGPV